MKNSKIAKALLSYASSTTSVDTVNLLSVEAKKIIEINNNAAHYGLIDLPIMVFAGVELDEDKAMVTVQPNCGIININDLYLLKHTWGADDLNVDKEGIELVFKK